MIPLMLRSLAAPVALLAALAGVVYISHSSGKQSGTQATQAKWDAEKVATLEAQGEQILLAQVRETELAAQMTQLKRTHRETQTRIAADHDRLVSGLRERPDRPSAGGVPEAASAGDGLITGCTGAQLYRPDGEFLAREARRADELRAAVQVCAAAYNTLTR